MAKGCWLTVAAESAIARSLERKGLAADPHVASGLERRRLSIAFSPDGRQVLAGLNGGLGLGDAQQQDQPRRLAGHAGPCSSIAFFPNGGRAVTGGHDQFVRLWNLIAGQELKRVGPLSGETQCTVSPDGRWVAVACLPDGSVRLYDANLEREHRLGDDAGPAVPLTPVGKRKRRPAAPANTGVGPALAFAPDSQSLATASVRGQIVIWDVAAKTTQRTIELPGAVYGLAFDSTGRYLATANGNGTVYLLRLAQSKRLSSDPAVRGNPHLKHREPP